MQKVRHLSRVARVVGLTLVVWPLVGSGGSVERSRATSLRLPSVGSCQASSLPGRQPAGLGQYDGNSGRCVVGSGSCSIPY